MFLTIVAFVLIISILVYIISIIILDCNLELKLYEIFGKSIAVLKGKVVFITGASSGIGEATAVALAKHGVKLVLTARRRNELERVKDRCLVNSNKTVCNSDILLIAADICDLNAHQKIFDEAVNYFGRVDILFNNAGRSQRANWEDIDIAVDKELYDLNVFSVVNLTRIAIRYFTKMGKGHIAVCSSLTGVVAFPNSASYTGSKHALHGYMNSLRIEKIRTDIAVSIICPGPVHTNFLKESFTDQPGIKYGIPVKPTDRRMTAERCGELCAITLANRIHETWVGIFPSLPFMYLNSHFPFIFNTLLKMCGPAKLFNFRDSK